MNTLVGLVVVKGWLFVVAVTAIMALGASGKSWMHPAERAEADLADARRQLDRARAALELAYPAVLYRHNAWWPTLSQQQRVNLRADEAEMRDAMSAEQRTRLKQGGFDGG